MSFDPLVPDPDHSQFQIHVAALTKLGFRFGEIGTHSSRTMMLSELTLLLNICPIGSRREDYIQAIVNNNCLGKRTLSTRKHTAQRLRELYGLDDGIIIFRIMRHFWDMDEKGRPLLALLTTLARDPILRMTVPVILQMVHGEELGRQKMYSVIEENLHERLNEDTIDKVVRHVSSSWTQSGHLTGRVRKIRRRVEPTPVVTTYTLFLGYLYGFRGEKLIDTLWAQVLDCSKKIILEKALDAKRMGLLEMTQAGGVLSITFNPLLMEEERSLVHGTN